MTQLDTEPPPDVPEIPPEMSITDIIPAAVRERVTIAPPEDWVSVHGFDREYRTDAGASTTILLSDCQYHARRNARYVRFTQRLETMRAVHDLAQWRLDNFDPGTDRLTIHNLSIHREGKVSEQAHVRRLRFMQREANLENLILSGRLTIAIILDDVRVGDILDACYTIEYSPRIASNKFGGLASVPTEAPICDFRISVRFPEDAPMKWKGSVEFGPPVVQTAGAEIEWSWSLQKPRPREIERNVPPQHLVFSWIQFSSYESWGEVAAQTCAAWQECFDDPAVLESARAIAAASSSQSVRADRAISLVQDNLRYLSLNTDLGGQVPAPPGGVLTRRFGDCKDKAFLLVHLLRWLGISARPALVNSRLCRGVDLFLPMPGVFNHAIVEYSINGQRRWVDATSPLQGGGALERSIPEFGLALPIGPGVTALEPIPVSPSKDYYHLRETFRLDTTGRPALLRVAISASGREAETLRQSIGMEGLEAVSRKREQFYLRFFPEVRRLDALEWRDDRAKNEILLAESYELPGAMTIAPSLNSYIFRYGSHLVQSLLSYPESTKRKQPLALSPKVRVEHFIDLESPGLPRGETENFVKRSTAFRFSCDTKKLFGRWAAHFTLRIIDSEVPQQHFDQFRDHVKEILPKTAISAVLPAGIVAARGKRRGLGPVLEETNTPQSRAKSASDEAGPMLGEAPAVALGPASEDPAHISPKTALIGPRKSEEDSNDDASERRLSSNEPGTVPPIDPGADNSAAPDLAPRRRRKRRKNRRYRWLLWTIPLILLVAAALTWYFLQQTHH